MLNITEFMSILRLTWYKALFNLRSEVQGNYLSYGWWVLEPLFHMLVYYIVFGFLLQRGGENFTVFLLTALVPWMWFSKSVQLGSSSIVQNKGLILQIGINSIVFPLISLLQTTIKQIPVFILLIIFVCSQSLTPTVYWWALLPVLFVQLLLTIFIACLVATIVPFMRDVALLIPTGLAFIMFLSGLFYDYRIISPEWQNLFLLNPVAFLFKSYREIFMEQLWPDFERLIIIGSISLLACLLLILLFRKLRYLFPRVIMR